MMNTAETRILCVTGNPCVDRIIWHHGNRAAPTRTYTQMGGKAADDARMLTYLNYDVTHMTIWNEAFETIAAREPFRSYNINIQHPIRVLPNYVDLSNRTTFLDYENTNRVSNIEALSFQSVFHSLISDHTDCLIIGGSACKGLEDTYPVIVREAKQLGRDQSGRQEGCSRYVGRRKRECQILGLCPEQPAKPWRTGHLHCLYGQSDRFFERN